MRIRGICGICGGGGGTVGRRSAKWRNPKRAKHVERMRVRSTFVGVPLRRLFRLTVAHLISKGGIFRIKYAI